MAEKSLVRHANLVLGFTTLHSSIVKLVRFDLDSSPSGIGGDYLKGSL